MRKVGDILKKSRQDKNLTLDDVEKSTMIRKKFLQAIENGDYSQFPSSTYIRGFIKNYSDYLNLPTNEILAVFRREYDKNETVNILPKGFKEPLNTSLARLTPTRVSIIIIVTLLIVFFGYLIKGYLSATGEPYLTVNKPKTGEKINSAKVLVEGKTDPDIKLTINNQPVLVNSDGSFSQDVEVNKNSSAILVIAENKQGKKTSIERIIEVELPK